MRAESTPASRMSPARLALAVGVVAGGCGVDYGPGAGNNGAIVGNFAGSYLGTVTQSGACADGTTLPAQSQVFALSITQSGTALRWTADCGVLATATASGDTASVQAYSCPARMIGTQTTRLSVTGGALTLQSGSLVVNITGQVTLSGAQTGYCSLSVTGTLARQG